MFYLPIIVLPVKTLAPVLARKAAAIVVAWGIHEMHKAISKKMESGEARDPVEALRLVANEWARWLKQDPNQGPATEGV